MSSGDDTSSPSTPSTPNSLSGSAQSKVQTKQDLADRRPAYRVMRENAVQQAQTNGTFGFSRLHSSLEQYSDDTRNLIVSAVRTLAVRYAILMPKFKAVAFFQPEDHVSHKHIRNTLPHRALQISHHASIFCSGAVLFLAQEASLRRMDPACEGDFSRAPLPAVTASGAVGGAAYSVFATGTAAWLGTGDNSLLQLRSWTFLRRALPYTLMRDAGGFACYFGVYKLAQGLAAGKLFGNNQDAAMAVKTNKMHLLTDTPVELARGVVVAATSGGLAGLGTYLWRSPWDTLYKRAVGWRSADAPLWSWQRFLHSPRGGRAMVVGAMTWSVYELADAGLRALAGES